MRCNPQAQVGLTALQQRKRDMSQCDPTPEPFQKWMCPGCDYIHIKCPIDMDIYRCKQCDWVGNRNTLLTAAPTPSMYIYEVEITHVNHT